MRLSGANIAPGLATGRAYVYQDVLEQDLHMYDILPEQVEAECERLHRAANEVLEDLKESARRVAQQIESYQSEIFTAHQMMLGEFLERHEIQQEVEKEQVNAEVAVHLVFQRWVREMHEDESTRFSQRADDIADLGRRLIRALRAISVHPLEKIPAGSILVASRLLPSDAIFFASRGVAAIVVERGTPSSHCALLTRQINVSGISNVSNVTETIRTGDLVCVDGFRAAVVVNPDKETQRSFEERIAEYHVRGVEARARCHEPAIAPNGVPVPVMANIANRADAQVAAQNGADGVGLYRLEGLFMLHKTLPTEQELLREMSGTLSPLGKKLAMIRLLDVGGDKSLTYLEFPIEPAPCLGRRGMRVLLAHPALLDVQLRTLLRLSQRRRTQIVVPMVTIPEDMQAVRNAVESQASQLGITEIPPLVAMIETPAAALSVPDILQFADALSLGTNDLTQHTMAAGRQNSLVQRYYQDDHPAVVRLIRLPVKEAGGAPVGVCGELAGQPNAVPMLLDAGIRLLSVAPPLVPTIKEAVRHPPE